MNIGIGLKKTAYTLYNKYIIFFAVLYLSTFFYPRVNIEIGFALKLFMMSSFLVFILNLKNVVLNTKKMQKVTSEKVIQSLTSKKILEKNSFNVILTSSGLELVDKWFRGKK